MRRILLSLLALSLLLVVSDRCVGRAMDALYRSSASEVEGDALGRAAAYRAPIVICGSSRARHHYVVDSLEVALGARAYNLGRDGLDGPLYSYAVAGTILRSYTPRLWVIEADSYICCESERLDRLSCLLPYVDESREAAEVVLLRSRHERLRLLSRTYRYNSLLLSLLAPEFGKRELARHGYVPLDGVMEGRAHTSTAAPAKVARPFERDSLKMKYLRRTIELLREHGVTPLAVHSPVWIGTPAAREEARRESELLRSVFAELGVRFMEFAATDDSVLDDARSYSNASHLNDRGAQRFTRLLADSIRSFEHDAKAR
jgi:hypothetical protein